MIEIIAALPHQRAAAATFGMGLRRHGVDYRITDSIRSEADTVVCWGWRIGSLHRDRGANVLVMERGYVGDRFHWTSLGWNGLNGRATFPEVDDGGARWRRHFDDTDRPWKRGGDYVLILGQVKTDTACRNVAIEDWYKESVAALSRHGLPIYFRHHPGSIERGMAEDVPGARIAEGELQDALAGAAWVVTWNSNSGVDAALAGVPVVACDEGAMAYPVAGHDVRYRPGTPDRDEWLSWLAWCQWTPNEISAGDAWEHLRTCL